MKVEPTWSLLPDADVADSEQFIGRSLKWKAPSTSRVTFATCRNTWRESCADGKSPVTSVAPTTRRPGSANNKQMRPPRDDAFWCLIDGAERRRSGENLEWVEEKGGRVTGSLPLWKKQPHSAPLVLLPAVGASSASSAPPAETNWALFFLWFCFCHPLDSLF